MRIGNMVQMKKKLGPTDVFKVSYGPKIAKLGHVTCQNLHIFGFLAPLRSFLVYPHNLEKDASAKKIVKIHQGYD